MINILPSTFGRCTPPQHHPDGQTLLNADSTWKLQVLSLKSAAHLNRHQHPPYHRHQIKIGNQVGGSISITPSPPRDHRQHWAFADRYDLFDSHLSLLGPHLLLSASTMYTSSTLGLSVYNKYCTNMLQMCWKYIYCISVTICYTTSANAIH